MIYTQDSNTVFYYSEYKVLLLLDFSKSTSTIYPHQDKSYIEKLQESIEIFIHVGIFPIKCLIELMVQAQ